MGTLAVRVQRRVWDRLRGGCRVGRGWSARLEGLEVPALSPQRAGGGGRGDVCGAGGPPLPMQGEEGGVQEGIPVPVGLGVMSVCLCKGKK